MHRSTHVALHSLRVGSSLEHSERAEDLRFVVRDDFVVFVDIYLS